MSTRRERLRFLVPRLDELADEIERTGREDESIRLADRLRNDPDAVAPVSDEEWETFLPKERERALPAYYLTLRSELIALEREGRKQTGASTRSWLDGVAPKAVGLAVGVATFVEFGIAALHAAGVFAHEAELLDTGSLLAQEGGDSAPDPIA